MKESPPSLVAEQPSTASAQTPLAPQSPALGYVQVFPFSVHPWAVGAQKGRASAQVSGQPASEGMTLKSMGRAQAARASSAATSEGFSAARP